MAYPGASPDELDQGWRQWFPGARQAEVVRTVSEQGKLRLYLNTPLSTRAIEDSVFASQSLPADVAEAEVSLSVTALPQGLPPRPKVASVPQLMVYINDSKAAALGISKAEITRALQGRSVEDIVALRKTLVRTQTGVSVSLGEVAEITALPAPSRIVRDFPQP